MKRVAGCVAVLLVCVSSVHADLTNPSTLTLKETSPSRFTVELTLPVIQGRVVKARPVFPDVCVIDGDAEVRGDATRAVRAWTMTCDPDDLVGTAIGVRGLLGTALDVQLTIETLDGRKYVGQLRPTQAYFLIPAAPTIQNMVVDVGGAAARQVLRRVELVILLALGVFGGMRYSNLLASAGAFAVGLALGQWLKTENWIGVSSFLPVLLAAAMGFVAALASIRGTASARLPWRTRSVVFALMGVLYGGGGLPVEMVLSRNQQYVALFFSALGTAAGLALVTLCAGQLRAIVAGAPDAVQKHLRFWSLYLLGITAGAIGLYQLTAPFFVGAVTPTVPFVTVLAALAFGGWSGAQSPATRAFLPAAAVCSVLLGLVLSMRGTALPQTTLAVYGSLAFVGLLLVWPVSLPRWIVWVALAASCLYHGAYAGGILRASVALPVAHATSMTALLVFLFLVAYLRAGQRGSGGPALRLIGLATALAALVWRFAEYRDWVGGQVAVDATMGLFRVPVLTVLLALAALVVWPRRRRFQPATQRGVIATHWCLVLVAMFTVSAAGVPVRNPFHTPRAPSANEARPVMAALLTDTYLAFNLPDEDAAFDRLAQNLSEDLVPGVYLDSRRRLTAGTRKGAEVTVKDVRVVSVDAPSGFDSSDGSFTYPCKWVVTARVKHWQHIHDRQNIYVGTLTIRVEDDRWKIDDLELLSEEREIVASQSS